jgi:hypothetical protein
MGLIKPRSRRTSGRRMSTPHRVAEVERPGGLDHDGVLEHDVVADELTEVADAGAEQNRHLADAEFVDEAEVQGLLDDVGAGDRDELVTGDLLRCRDSLFYAAGEGCPRSAGDWRRFNSRVGMGSSAVPVGAAVSPDHP